MVDNNHRKGLRSKKSEERRVKKEEFKSEKRRTKAHEFFTLRSSLFTYFTLGFCKPYPFLLSSKRRRKAMRIAITPKQAKMVIVWV